MRVSMCNGCFPGLGKNSCIIFIKILRWCVSLLKKIISFLTLNARKSWMSVPSQKVVRIIISLKLNIKKITGGEMQRNLFLFVV